MSDTISTTAPCEAAPCQAKGLESIPQTPSPTTKPRSIVHEDCNKPLEGKPLLYAGVVLVGAFKKFLIPTSCSATATAAAPAVVTSSSPDKKETNEPSNVRSSELPIYLKEETPSPPKCDPRLSSDSVLYSSVRKVRKCIWRLIDEGKILGQQACDYIETGKAHTASTLAFLREEENTIHRYGAIGIGGLTGLVLALRRGKFKKLLYTTAGATAMAALCYPKEAKQYTVGGEGLKLAKQYTVGGEGLKLAKQYIVIVYHFINCEPGPEQPEPEQPGPEQSRR